MSAETTTASPPGKDELAVRDSPQIDNTARRKIVDKIHRFWSKVQRCEHDETCPDCCWLWMSAMSHNGYGLLGTFHDGRTKNVRAHRASWEFTNGPIPAGLCVLHNCPGGDNRACVNPQHLWVGTQKENTHDAIKKGRMHHPLTDEQVQDIRYLSAHGMPQPLLGRIYQVHRTLIGKILLGQRWASLPLTEEGR